VDCVASGDAATSWLHEQRADLLILDFMLPDTNAERLLDSLGELRPSHVIVMTGCGDERTAVSMLRLGVFDYVVKAEGFLDDLELSIRRAMAHIDVQEQLRRKIADLEAVTARLRVAEKFEAIGRLAGAPSNRVCAAAQIRAARVRCRPRRSTPSRSSCRPSRPSSRPS
jgi:DNA-binding NtrC family response regulator